MSDPYERAVELYRAESIELMRDHFFRLALNYMSFTDRADLVERMASEGTDDLRESLRRSGTLT